MKFADLHLHTLYSDSTYSPFQLIEAAARKGLACIAVTDHDTVNGIAPAMEAALNSDVEILPGIELTAEFEGLEIHILGYLLDQHNKNLLSKLENLRKIRIERVKKIVKKLKDLGLNLEAESVFELAPGGTVGRLHIARAMVKERLVGSIGEAFFKYIGDRCPAYVLGFKLSPHEAVKLIKDAGGIPVLAHPYALKNDKLIPRFVEFGIMGLEVYYPEHTSGMINSYLGLAKKHHLLVTGGSDCHGAAKPEVKIGSVKIPYKLVEDLKAAKERLL